MDRQCSSCGGFCKKSGCERENVQPEPEPVAWGIANTRPTEKQPLMMVMLDKPEPSHLVIPLYTAPPRRELCQCDDIHNDCTYKKNCRVPQIDAAFKRIEWQGLTDAEIELFCGQSDHSTWNAIELAQSRLKEKNL